MDMDEIDQGERECLRGQVAKLQQRVTELQEENAKLRDSLDAAMRLADAEAERFGETVKQLR